MISIGIFVSKILQLSPILETYQQYFYKFLQSIWTKIHKSLLIGNMGHFGNTIKSLRESLGLSQKELGLRMEGMSDESISKWEGMEKPRLRGTSFSKLAKALGLTKEELNAKWQSTTEFDLNVQPYSEQPVPDIPTFDLPIAAGPWMELPETMEMNNPAILRDGRFRVHIRGDSMEKVYPDGSLVEFRCLRPEMGDGRGSKLEPGKDYYVQRAECATFKRLVSFDNDMLVFSAINKRKYPEKIKVLRSDLSRMAKVEYILRRPEQ